MTATAPRRWTPEQLIRAQTLFERGLGPEVIAQHIGLPTSMICEQANRRRWFRPPPPPPPRIWRRCQYWDCQQVGKQDTRCDYCHRER